MVEPVFTIGEARHHPQFEDRGRWQKVEHPELGKDITYFSGFGDMSDAICKVWRRAPLIGEHNIEIYQGELGFSARDITILKQAGVI